MRLGGKPHVDDEMIVFPALEEILQDFRPPWRLDARDQEQRMAGVRHVRRVAIVSLKPGEVSVHGPSRQQRQRRVPQGPPPGILCIRRKRFVARRVGEESLEIFRKFLADGPAECSVRIEDRRVIDLGHFFAGHVGNGRQLKKLGLIGVIELGITQPVVQGLGELGSL